MKNHFSGKNSQAKHEYDPRQQTYEIHDRLINDVVQILLTLVLSGTSFCIKVALADFIGNSPFHTQP